MLKVRENINNFKRDLKNNDFSEEYIIRKYLCNGSSPVLDDDIMFQIKHKISEKFKIHPNEVIITGSGKLGFSIAHDKKYKPFNDDSDIDVAIISERLFNDFWLELLNFNINLTSRTLKENENYNKFKDYFFKGWIRPDLFPFNYQNKNIWFSFFSDLTNELYSYGEHKVAAGIFKNFKAFEIYNIQNIKNLRRSTDLEKYDDRN